MEQSQWISAADLSRRYDAGTADPVDVAEQVLARIESADPAIFTLVTAERARREAVAARERQRSGKRRGVLDGVPIAWKDLFDLAGVSTTAGSRALPDRPSPRDAEVVANVAAEGAVTVGRVNMSEFAFSGLGLNPIYGTPGNARDRARIPGGSSSGSAVAVAAGLVPISIGTDTGGSVRIPAALNGIIGYKSTAGRYSMAGVFPLSRTLDSLGVLSTTLEDAAFADAAMRGAPYNPIAPALLDGLRIVVPTNVVFKDCAEEVATNFERAIAKLERAGASITRTFFPVFDSIIELFAKHGALVNADAYALHRERLEGLESRAMDRRVVDRAKLGARTSPSDRDALISAHRDLGRQSAAMLDGAIVAYPTTPIAAPEIAVLEADDQIFFHINSLMLRNTMLGNFLRWCGVSIPNGVDRAGMPTGLLLSGPAGTDERLLSCALAIEAAIKDASPNAADRARRVARG